MIFGSEHPDVASMQASGYPCGAAPENANTAQARREFAEEYIGAFIEYAEDGDMDILDRFADYMGHVYKNWLN